LAMFFYPAQEERIEPDIAADTFTF